MVVPRRDGGGAAAPTTIPASAGETDADEDDGAAKLNGKGALAGSES